MTAEVVAVALVEVLVVRLWVKSLLDVDLCVAVARRTPADITGPEGTNLDPRGGARR